MSICGTLKPTANKRQARTINHPCKARRCRVATCDVPPPICGKAAAKPRRLQRTPQGPAVLAMGPLRPMSPIAPTANDNPRPRSNSAPATTAPINYQLSTINYQLSTINFPFPLTASVAGKLKSPTPLISAHSCHQWFSSFQRVNPSRAFLPLCLLRFISVKINGATDRNSVSTIRSPTKQNRIVSPAILRLVLSLFFVAAVTSHSKDPAQVRRPSRSLKEVIVRARAIPAASLHQWLREESIVATTFAGETSFKDAVKAARDAKLPLLEGWENGSAILRRYKLRENVFKFGNGRKADAYLFFMARNKKEAASPFIAARVQSVEIGLLVEIGLTYQQTIDQKIFPEGTALRRSLDLDKVKEAGAIWPWLDRIVIDYGQDGNRWLEYNPCGFNFETRFVASRSKDVGENEIRGFIPSGLDRERDWQGKAGSGDFTPQDTLGDPDFRGGSYTVLPEELKLKPEAAAPSGATLEKK